MDAGTLLAERFEIQSLAGAGGMGSVYRARDHATHRDVAVKVLNPGIGHAERFALETSILSELDHPSIVAYVAHGTAPAGRPFLVMEWLDGEDLAARQARERLDLGEALEITRQVAGALARAHELGIVHRDIKPSNVYLVDGDIRRVKVLDFGIARLHQTSSRITLLGAALGTPDYMAPEQARGDAHLDARADVFALGCMLFESITRRLPFPAQHAMAVLAKIVFDEPPRVLDLRPDIPPELDALVGQMLAKDPAHRPSDGGAVVRALDALERQAPLPRPAPIVPAPVIHPITMGERHLLSVIVATRASVQGPVSEHAPTVVGQAEPDLASLLEPIVEAHGGAFATLLDGALVVTLSGSAVATDQVARAARCALAIRSEVTDLRIGLATGRGFVSGKLPTGDVIEGAVELITIAGAYESIRIDELTAGLLDASFELGSDDDGLLLIRENRDRPSVRRLLGRPTPCFGREEELGELSRLLERTVETRSPHAAIVVGGAGSGKSRLRHELLERVDRRSPHVQVWQARGDSISAGAPFGMVAAVIRRIASLRIGEPEALWRRRLRARVARNVRGPLVPRVTEFLAEMVGAPFDEDASVELTAARQDAVLMGDQLRAAWLDLIAAEAETRPVFLVLEDLHWGDAPSVHLVEQALRRIRGPLFVLALAREEAFERFPNPWSSSFADVLRLGPLSDEAATALARTVLADTADADAIRSIVARADGNPLFLEELIRSAANGEREATPDTAIAMVQKRLEALSAEERRILRAASVFGSTFWAAGVQHLIGDVASETTAEALTALAGAELIERRGHSRLARHREFAFRHDLVRLAAHEMLTGGDRRVGHRLAAEWLAGAGERDAFVLAEHLERGGDGPRAASWYLRAAEQALEGGDFGWACEVARRGLSCGGAPKVAGRLQTVSAEALRWQGRFEEASAAASAAALKLPEGSTEWFQAHDELIQASGRLGDYQAARDHRDVAAHARAIDRREALAAQVLALCSAARQTFHAGRYDEADALLEYIERLAADGVPPRTMAEVHRLRGARARHLGDLSGDIAGYGAALSAFEAAGDARGACNARVSLAFAYVEVGDHDVALGHLESALEQTERLGLDAISTRARQNLGLVHTIRDNLVLARQLLEDAVEESRVQANVRFEGWTRIYLSRVALELGDLALAEAQAEKAEEMLRVTAPARAGALASLARVRVAQGRVEPALEAAREAMSIVHTYGGIEEFESFVWLTLALTQDAAGDSDSARETVRAARSRLTARADGIRQSVWRTSFLTKVPDNARLMSLAAAWLPDDPEVTERSKP